MPEPGARVWTVRNADSDRVYAFGFGTYAGDHPRPWAPTSEEYLQAEHAVRNADRRGLTDPAERLRPMAERAAAVLHDMSISPKIILDGGAGVVWGCECSWGEVTIEALETWVRGREVVIVPAPWPAEDEPDLTPGDSR